MEDAPVSRTDTNPGQQSAEERREPTGVPGLDVILSGGIARGSLALIMGVPGSGKTTLASQIAFNAAKEGKRVLILTALSESTNKLLAHLRSFSFFASDLIGQYVHLFSLQGALSGGLKATGKEIMAEARRIGAEVILIDGFRGMRSVDVDPAAARELLYTLGTTLGVLGVTTLITSETDPNDPSFYPETTTADIILGLHYQLAGVRQYRGIEVVKARGAAPLPGLHALTLGADGAAVYPQLEERVQGDSLSADRTSQDTVGSAARPLGAVSPLERAAFDLPELDTMLQGGLPRTSCTLLTGSLGTGKTCLALQWTAAGLRAGEPVVFLGMREDRERVRLAAAPFTIGAELERELNTDGGNLTFLEVAPIKINADILADRVLAELDRTCASRLVVDSIAELERAILRGLDPNRLEDFLAAFLRALQQRRVTALLLKESDKTLGPTLDFSVDALSVLAENVLLLQQVPYRGALHRILSIPKLRLSAHDTTLREFRIAAPDGFEVLEPFASDAGVLAGITEDQEQAQRHASGQSGQPGRRGTRADDRGESERQ
jgi:circadian clock protein KaiC